MALSITDLKKGTVFKFDGHPYKVLEYSQKVLGRGGSIVNVKIKNLSQGNVLEKTFKGSEVLQPADIQRSNAQFLYADEEKAYFMDDVTFETYEIASNNVAQLLKYLSEGVSVQLLFFEGRPIDIEPPKNVYLKVTAAQDVVKGDTASAITKEAEVETGAVIRVPPFIKAGDIISVDTTTGNYRERKKD